MCKKQKKKKKKKNNRNPLTLGPTDNSENSINLVSGIIRLPSNWDFSVRIGDRWVIFASTITPLMHHCDTFDLLILTGKLSTVKTNLAAWARQIESNADIGRQPVRRYSDKQNLRRVFSQGGHTKHRSDWNTRTVPGLMQTEKSQPDG